ncbi:ABC transporter ATP-binding protein [Candidatus Villigracilis affinis]|jgi:ABC-2 type transport system ATP-binding protein|uniref:ABC transporter ATP-binding protein n=1 Tax=Candidatus Villigracilis affinis TaxID=3140682 RepID=UPI002A1EF405|nr:ABC transporter ATP-binding protein [Anaerolineales bacterium]
MSIPAIKTENLRKEFGTQAAVKGLTLQVEQGEVFGFLGPNGAGKTTSIKMLLGLVAPTSGTGALLGAPLGDRAALARIGFLPEHFRFQEWLTANEFLELHGELLGMDSRSLYLRRDELLERVGLIEFRHKQLRTFSKGMLQRIGLAQALMNHPALVFLDEPTSGLDPVGRRLVRDIIHELREEGTSVFLNSHLLSEIEVTCNRVAFIRHGEVVRVMEMSSLDKNASMLTIRAIGLTPESLAGLAQWGDDIRVDGDHLTMTIRRDSDLPEINRHLVERGVQVYALTPNRLSLEEIFIETLGKDSGL